MSISIEREGGEMPIFIEREMGEMPISIERGGVEREGGDVHLYRGRGRRYTSL